MPRVTLPRSILRVSGDDAGPFLDAILTQDVSRASPSAPMYAALLSAQGKVFADLFAHRGPDGSFLLDMASSLARDVLARLSVLRLRRKVTIEAAPELCVVADFSSGASPVDPRLPGGALGARVIVADGEAFDMPFATYEARRIRAGVPDPAVDAAPEEIFALEALLEELHGVDFQKGCFIGQENVSRMKRRATTRRKLCRIAFNGPSPTPGTAVTSGSATLGDVRTGVDGAAIALLRLDRALATKDPLLAGDVRVRLDPPSFLILPSPEES